jgi:hypothetical protein
MHINSYTFGLHVLAKEKLSFIFSALPQPSGCGSQTFLENLFRRFSARYLIYRWPGYFPGLSQKDIPASIYHTPLQMSHADDEFPGYQCTPLLYRACEGSQIRQNNFPAI